MVGPDDRPYKLRYQAMRLACSKIVDVAVMHDLRSISKAVLRVCPDYE